MGTGYTRQSTSSIQPGQPVASTPINNEYNQLEAAFDSASGHNHTGSANGAPLTRAALSGLAANGLVAATSSSAFAARSLVPPAAGVTITDADGVAGNPTFALSNDLAGVEGLSTTGIAVRSATDTWVTRTLTGPAAGITVTNGGGVAGNPTLALSNDLAGVEGLATNGLAARTGTDTWATRTLTAPAAGITVSNGDGVSGNPTMALANDLAALEAMSGTGIVARTASETYAQRTITGTANQITATNGDGVSGNPTLSLPSSITAPGSIAVTTTLGVTGVTTLSSQLRQAQGANIASATTTDLSTVAGNSVTVTGTTTITGFGTVQAGTVMHLTFSGILTLTHNGTSLILPSSANITTAAGDVATMVSLGSGNWKCLNYTRANGTTLVLAGGGSGSATNGQVLTADGSGASSWEAVSSGSFVLLESFSTSSLGAVSKDTIAFVNDSLYIGYQVYVDIVSASGVPRMRINNGGTPATTGYQHLAFGSNGSSGYTESFGVAGGDHLALAWNDNSADGRSNHFFSRNFSYYVQSFFSRPSAVTNNGFYGGGLTSGAWDRLTFYSTSGNITSLYYSIFGIRKS